MMLDPRDVSLMLELIQQSAERSDEIARHSRRQMQYTLVVCACTVIIVISSIVTVIEVR